MTNLLDIIKQKGVPIKNSNKRKKYSKDEDSEPLKLVFRFKSSDSSEHSDSDDDTTEYDTVSETSSKTNESISSFDINEFNELSDEQSKHIVQLIHQTIKKEKDINYTKFIETSINKYKYSDEEYFTSLSIIKQKHLLDKLKEINESNIIQDKPIRFKIIDSDIPDNYKFIVLSKLNHLTSLMPFDTNYHKLKLWIDSFLLIPFGKYCHLPVAIHHGLDACQIYMENAKDILDKTVYGLNDAKFQIMQFISHQITNPNSIGSAIALKGQMGTGKTTLIKEGISKILNRPFELIALGGATDSCFLEGHSYTYEGSIYGKIIEILIKTKCMNPIIYFDELDKVSNTPKGEEIIGILTHLIDTSQNDKFHDRYFSDIEFNLSKCLFIFSYNDESLVNPILRDRMHTITVDGYNTHDKLIIVKDYLIPSIIQNIHLEDIIIPNETIQYLIENIDQEHGVRNIKRCIENIYSKLNLFRLMKSNDKLFNEDSIDIQFPFTVSIDIAKKLIKFNKQKSYYNLYL